MESGISVAFHGRGNGQVIEAHLLHFVPGKGSQ